MLIRPAKVNFIRQPVVSSNIMDRIFCGEGVPITAWTPIYADFEVEF